MPTRVIRHCTISSSIRISPTSSQRRSRTGALLSQARSSTVLLCRPSALRSPTSTAIGRRGCRQIFSRRSETFFGAHTYERIDKPGVFHTEWLEADRRPAEKTAAPKKRRNVTPANKLVEIVRLASDELLVRKRFDLLRFDQNHAVGILHFAFDR